MNGRGANQGVLADPRFAPFRQADFSTAEFTSKALAGAQRTAQAQAEDLRAGLRQLDHELNGHIVGHHAELLANVRKLGATEHSLQGARSCLGCLGRFI